MRAGPRVRLACGHIRHLMEIDLREAASPGAAPIRAHRSFGGMQSAGSVEGRGVPRFVVMTRCIATANQSASSAPVTYVTHVTHVTAASGEW